MHEGEHRCRCGWMMEDGGEMQRRGEDEGGRGVWRFVYADVDGWTERRIGSDEQMTRSIERGMRRSNHDRTS